MTERSDFERRLATWLDEEGPQSVPDRIVEAAIAEAITTRRRRRLPEPVLAVLAGLETLPTRSWLPMRPAWLATLIAVTLLTLGLLATGAFLFQVDRLRTNGPIAFDMAGDIYTYDALRDDAPVQFTSTIEVQERAPMYSPDGRYLAWWTTAVASSELHVRDFETGRTIVLGDDHDLILPLHSAPFGWSPDSMRLAIPARATSPDGTQVGLESVILFDVTTRDVELVPADEPVWSFGWSPDGRYVGLVGETGLIVFDADSREVRPIRGPGGDPTEVPYWLTDSPPVFTADSTAVMYTDAPSLADPGDIWRISIHAPLAEAVVVDDANHVAPVVRRDGDAFVFAQSSAVTVSESFARSSDPLDAQRIIDRLLVARSQGEPTVVATNVWPRAMWSPDGRWLVTRSSDHELVLIDVEQPDQSVRVPTHDTVGDFSWGPQPP